MPIPNADIAEVVELFQGRGGGYDDQFERDYTRVFRVRTQDEYVGAIKVEFAEGIPRVFDTYVGTGEFDALATCRSVRPSQSADDPLYWVVTCEYRTKSRTPIGAINAPPPAGQPGHGGGSPTDNPEQRQPRVEWSFQEWTLPMRGKDLAGKAVQNSAHEPFTPPPVYQVACPLLQIERYQIDFDAELAAFYAYATNSDDFLFAERDEAQMLPITARQELIGSTLFWKVLYRIRFATFWPFTWQVRVLDAGYRHLNTAGDGWKPNLDEIMKQPLTVPHPLRPAGRCRRRRWPWTGRSTSSSRRTAARASAN